MGVIFVIRKTWGKCLMFNIGETEKIITRTLGYYLLVVCVLIANISTTSNHIVFLITFITLIITFYFLIVLLYDFKNLKYVDEP